MLGHYLVVGQITSQHIVHGTAIGAVHCYHGQTVQARRRDQAIRFQAMAFRQIDPQGLIQYHLATGIGCPHRTAHKTQIQLPSGHGPFLLVGRQTAQHHIHLWKSSTESRQDCRKNTDFCRRHKTYRQHFPGLRSRLAGTYHRLVYFLQNLAGIIQKNSPGFRQLDFATSPVQQGIANLFLQITDLLAQGGLRGVKPLGSTGEIQLFRDCNEVTQVSQFQVCLLSN